MLETTWPTKSKIFALCSLAGGELLLPSFHSLLGGEVE